MEADPHGACVQASPHVTSQGHVTECETCPMKTKLPAKLLSFLAGLAVLAAVTPPAADAGGRQEALEELVKMIRGKTGLAWALAGQGQ